MADRKYITALLIGIGLASIAGVIELQPSERPAKVLAAPTIARPEPLPQIAPHPSEPPQPSTQASRPEPSAQARAPSLPALREQWLSQGNFRARVHAVLGSADPVGLRLALESDAYCVSAPMLTHFKSAPEGASQSLRDAWSRYTQRCTGDNARRLDDHQRRALLALRQRLEGSNALLQAYVERESISDAQWQRIVAQRDGDLALLYGAKIVQSEQTWAQVVGDDPLLRQVRPSLVQLAWFAEVCGALGCQSDSTCLELCLMSQLCTPSSYIEQLDAIAGRLGVSPDEWGALRRATAGRVRDIFGTG